MKTLEHNKVEIAYREEGQGDTTLLFVHGSYINKEYWDAQMDYFSKDYHVVAIDLAAHGQSGTNRSTWTFAEFAQDVITVVKTLDLHNVILVGHSMGGDICLEVADQLPDTVIGLIAVDYFKYAGTEMPTEFLQQVDSILANLQTNFADTNEAYARKGLISPQTSPILVDRIVNDYRNAYKEMAIPITAQLFRYYARQRELLLRLKFKLHLINVDYFPTDESLLQKYAGNGYELIHMSGTSHYPMVESPEVFNTLLKEAVVKCVNDQNLIHFSDVSEDVVN